MTDRPIIDKIKCPKCGKMESRYFIEKDGECLFCGINARKEREKKFDSDRAVEDGEGRSTVDAICPYCGHYHPDSWENDDEVDIDCGECGKTFHMQKEYETTYITTKIED